MDRYLTATENKIKELFKKYSSPTYSEGVYETDGYVFKKTISIEGFGTDFYAVKHKVKFIGIKNKTDV